MENNTVLTKTEPSVKLTVTEETIAALDKAAENGLLAQSITSQFKKMFLMGACMQELRALLTPQVMKPIMQLQNSPVGFMTDRKEGYGVEVVTNCVIEAAMNGVSVVGNEFNILVGRFYCTKNGMKHKLRDIPGLYKNLTPGIPRLTNDRTGAVERMHIEWTYGGKSNAKDIEFAIRVNAGMGADAIIGKATRKALAWLYEEVTGNTVSEGEVGDVVVMTEEKPGKFFTAKPASAIQSAPEPSDLEKLEGLLNEKGIPLAADAVKEYVEKQGEIFSFDMVAPNIDKIAEAILQPEVK